MKHIKQTIYSIHLQHTKMRLLYCLVVCSLFHACTQEDYETGDGDYSYLRADFAEVHTNDKGQIYSAMTDDGDSLRLSKYISSRSMSTADTTYRALLYYYNKVESDLVEPYAASAVSVPNVRMTSKLRNIVKTDPVSLQSAWLSKNLRYLNLGLVLKTGTPDDDKAQQTIGIVCDSITANADNTQRFHLRLYHDQGDVPEYYSASVYMSIPLKRMPKAVGSGDIIEIAVRTYEGVVKRSFTL